MYAALYGGQPTVQGIQLLQDLKLGQYIKIPPRVNFIVQILGCIVGAILNYVMMYVTLFCSRGHTSQTSLLTPTLFLISGCL